MKSQKLKTKYSKTPRSDKERKEREEFFMRKVEKFRIGNLKK
jgi:hypothetical protein|tara:strand:+ start:3059 stop:3184 length:126 start_codon:yes stop_codon:yes gene_type:complete